MLIQSSAELGENSGPSSSSLPLQVKKLRPQSSCFLRKPQHSRALVCFSRPCLHQLLLPFPGRQPTEQCARRSFLPEGDVDGAAGLEP